jgi:hypothetical protein
MTVDITKLDPDGWEIIRWKVDKDDHPTKEELIAKMRERGVPEDMGAYVADRLTSNAQRGRPSADTPAGRRARFRRALHLQYAVLFCQAELLLKGKSRASARGLAIDQVASEQKPRHLSSERLRDILKEGRRNAPDHWALIWPRLVDVEAHVKKRAAAQSRLNRMKARKKKP